MQCFIYHGSQQVINIRFFTCFQSVSLPLCCSSAHPHYLPVHSCMSCSSAVCIVALLVAAINSGVAETGEPPSICLCLCVESGPGEESEGAVYPAFVLLSVCPAGSVSAGGFFARGWVEWGGRTRESGIRRLERVWELCRRQVHGWRCSEQGSGICHRSPSFFIHAQCAHPSGLTAGDTVR